MHFSRGREGEGGLQFLHKNKLKSEIFNNKKSLLTKMFFPVITQFSNLVISKRCNLVIFKRWDGFKDEKF